MLTRRLVLKASVALHDPATVPPDPKVRLADQPRPQRGELRPAADVKPVALPTPLMSDRPSCDPPSLPSAFLAQNLNPRITVYLMSGLRRRGTLKQADPFTRRLQVSEGREELIFRHLIDWIVPASR